MNLAKFVVHSPTDLSIDRKKTMTKITGKKALKLMREAVQDKGADYVYPNQGGCFYSESERHPSCLVGEVLSRTGVSNDLLSSLDEIGVVGCIPKGTWRDIDIEPTAKAISIFQAAQRSQDNGQTWGVALEAAEYKARAL